VDALSLPADMVFDSEADGFALFLFSGHLEKQSPDEEMA